MTTNPAAAFLLVQDKVGYKYDNVVKHMVKRFFGTPQSTSRVLRGELLKEYHHEEKNYNYVLQKDPSVFLRCADEEVAPLLTQKEFMLLQGIEKRMDRFEAFTEGMLDLGSSLKPGSGVFVTIYNEGHVNTRLIRATVHYIGEVEGYHGFQFGVELKVSTSYLTILCSVFLYVVCNYHKIQIWLLCRLHTWWGVFCYTYTK